jgi:Ca-activated chloride channel family protein
LTTATQTAIGSAILTALDAIAEVDKRVTASAEPGGMPSPKELPSLNPSHVHYVPHIIVLLTDGASNTGPSPLTAAQKAAQRGVRIYSIGFGTTNSAIMDCWNTSGSEALSSPGLPSQAGDGSSGNAPDETTLKEISKITGGKFYSATSAGELQTVFQDLHRTIAVSNKTVEVSVFFAALGIALAMLALFLSILWHPLL